MKTIQINLYPFCELKEYIRSKILIDHIYLNVDDNWWEVVYEDARNIGIKLTSFDIGQGRYCRGEWMFDAGYTARKIIEQHGGNTATYLATKLFLNAQQDLLTDCHLTSDGNLSCTEDLDCFREVDEKDYLQHLLRLYLQMLNREYEYLITDQAIQETIEVNQYWFTAEGDRADKLHRMQLNHLENEF